jgi:hypothetical protein
LQTVRPVQYFAVLGMGNVKQTVPLSAQHA